MSRDDRARKEGSTRALRQDIRRFERMIASVQAGLNCCRLVTVAQCHVLLEVERIAPCSLMALSRALDLNKSTVSRAIEALVAKGMVQRIPDASDRRYVRVALTDLGRTTCQLVHEENDRFFEDRLGSLSQSKRSLLINHFHELVTLLSESKD